MRSSFLFYLAVLLGSVFLSGPISAREFFGLGFIPGGSFSNANSISADGRVVVGFGKEVINSNLREAFRWTAETGMQGLGFLPGLEDRSEALDVSADGRVIVGSGGGIRKVSAFRWTAETGMQGFPPEEVTGSIAHSISADGQVIVGLARLGDKEEAFRWTVESGMQGLGFLEETDTKSVAYDISADGNVVAGNSTGFRVSENVFTFHGEAFRWTEQEGMVGLGEIINGNVIARATSADGSVIVGNIVDALIADPDEVFRWTEETGLVRLGGNVGGSSRVIDITADGSTFLADGHDGALLWDAENGFRKLQDILTDDFGIDLTGWGPLTAGGMTPDGRIFVGSAINPSGQREAWMAIIPEPSTATLASIALLMLLVLCVVRRRSTSVR